MVKWYVKRPSCDAGESFSSRGEKAVVKPADHGARTSRHGEAAVLELYVTLYNNIFCSAAWAMRTSSSWVPLPHNTLKTSHCPMAVATATATATVGAINRARSGVKAVSFSIVPKKSCEKSLCLMLLLLSVRKSDWRGSTKAGPEAVETKVSSSSL